MNSDVSTLICADDFGYSKGINKAIIELLKKDIIGACSVMVLGEISEQDKRYLEQSKYQIGLHLDFTHFTKIWYSPNVVFTGILLRLNLISSKMVRKKILSQIKRFKYLFGRYPDFIDGHQHIHQFYRVYDELVGCCNDIGISDSIWIRDSRDRRLSLKARVINFFTSDKFDLLISRHGLKTKLLIGVYNFRDSEIFEENLNQLNKWPNGVMMCHPSTNVLDGQFRLKEYQILNNDN